MTPARHAGSATALAPEGPEGTAAQAVAAQVEVAQAGQVRRRQQRLDVPAVQTAFGYRQGADADALRGGGEDRHRAVVVRAHVLVLER